MSRYEPDTEDLTARHARPDFPWKMWRASTKGSYGYYGQGYPPPSLRQLRERLQGLKEHTHCAYHAEPQQWTQGPSSFRMPPPPSPTPESAPAPAQSPATVPSIWTDERFYDAVDPDASREREREHRGYEVWMPLWKARFAQAIRVPTYEPSDARPRMFTASANEQVLVTDPTKQRVYVFFAGFPNGPIGRTTRDALAVEGRSLYEGERASGRTRRGMDTH